MTQIPNRPGPRAGESDEVTLRKMPAPDHSLREDHPELYGQMLIANERIEDAGSLGFWVAAALVLGLCVTIHMAWVDPVFGVPVERLQSWGVYALIVIVAFTLYFGYIKFAEKAAWHRTRDPIVQYLRKHRLTAPWLITQIENDDSVSEVAEQLKADSSSLI